MEQLKFSRLIEKMSAFAGVMRDFSSGRASHAYMLIGEDEELLSEFAVSCAAAYFCGKAPACKTCRSCKNVYKGVHPDLHVYPREGEARIDVADVAEIVESCFLRSVEGAKKTYILKNVSKMLPPAQNKLLKILEEPPADVLFLLLVTNEASVLTTVRSRTAQTAVERVAAADILEYLTARYGVSDRAKAISVICDGLIGAAERMMADDEYYEMYGDMFRVLIGLDHSSKILSRCELLLKHEKKIEEALSFLQIVLRDVLLFKTDQSLVKNTWRLADIEEISSIYPQAAVIGAIECVDEARKRLRFNCGKRAVCDHLFISILEVRRKCLL